MSKNDLPFQSSVCVCLPAKWLITLYEQQKNCWNMTNCVCFWDGAGTTSWSADLKIFSVAIRSPPLASQKRFFSPLAASGYLLTPVSAQRGLSALEKDCNPNGFLVRLWKNMVVWDTAGLRNGEGPFAQVSFVSLELQLLTLIVQFLAIYWKAQPRKALNILLNSDLQFSSCCSPVK